MEKFKLKRTTQCGKCPWKVSTDPNKIPGGYSREKHEALSCTISNGLNLGGRINAMACHHSNTGDEHHCVGWLYNQLGVGNNIALRMHMRNCENLKNLKVIGKQHERFQQTLK